MKIADKKTVALLLGIACFDMALAFLVINQDMLSLHKENGFLENMQVFALFLTICVFLLQPLFSKCYHRIFSWAGAYLCFTFLLRELDVEDFDLPAIVILVGSGTGRNIVMASLGIALVVYCIARFQTIKVFLPRFFFARSSLLFLAGSIFLVLGGLFDDGGIDVLHYQFYEEILELTGYYLMFTGAVVGCSCKQ